MSQCVPALGLLFQLLRHSRRQSTMRNYKLEQRKAFIALFRDIAHSKRLSKYFQE